ncbi:DNA-3-methyladenine glycosylase family protein [Streptomyces sp. H27-D2]|uniref:DNA-3-methyladenine glycosylase family protein n=1 Tax=Streptomyces sp. H27-D2 TaxID=3046304 RepID=UPI002DB8DA9E|nr:DNA-3-methyladenine glycosylase 2 family protein [Streptomyces sp. H27-D2]MEC4018747.1 DNA-3-methyladenine glycosylase 2 family protein [Streptomyces sp. H27-D2]
MAAIRSWSPTGPYDLGRNLGVLRRGPGDPAYRVTPDGSVWRASRTPAGPGTIRLTPGGGGVSAEAWGPGAQWLLDGLPALLGGDDDPAAFTPRHRLVHEAHRRNPGLRLIRTGLVLESLIPSILEQKVTSDEAYRAWRLLLSRHGEPAPGPAPGPGGPDERMRVMPSARGWALIPSWEWHRAGVDGKRSAAIVRAARAAARIEETTGMDPAAAAARLQAVPGVGPWTAAETLQRSHGAPDAVTVGDLHLPRIIGYSLTGAHRTDDATMLELLTPYEGQRHRATRLILLRGSAPPRRAPRYAVNDIRGL